MAFRRHSSRARTGWAILATALAAATFAAPAPEDDDPLTAAVALWQQRIRTQPALDEETKSIRAAAAPRVDDAERALANGQRWVALLRMALVWPDLEAAEFRTRTPADLRAPMADLEYQWARLGPELSEVGSLGERPELLRLPAAARAVAEAALAQVPVYYAASLDYGKNTAPEYGMFYLGAARAQLNLARWIAKLPSRRAGLRPLQPRDLSFEIAAANDELAAAYVPPRSIDSHAVFIRISALLKEAGELAEAGARYGALQRLLDARARLSRLVHPGRSLSAEEATSRGRTVSAALDTSGRHDRSVEQMFLELALFSATDTQSRAEGGGEVAAAIFDDVLPTIPKLLGPAPPRPPERKAEATVTLVRWPYT